MPVEKRLQRSDHNGGPSGVKRSRIGASNFPVRRVAKEQTPQQICSCDTRSSTPSDYWYVGSELSSRSPSPTMTMGALSCRLINTRPSVSCSSPALLLLDPPKRGSHPPPPLVQKVLEWFYSTVEAGVGIIPYILKENFQSEQSNYAGFSQRTSTGVTTLTPKELFPDHLFDSELAPSPESRQYASVLREYAENIVIEAAQQHISYGDEANWAPIIKKILQGPIQGGLLRPIHSVTKHLDTSLLPVTYDASAEDDTDGEDDSDAVYETDAEDECPVQSCRIDFVLSFDCEDPRVYNLLRKYRWAQLSIFQDKPNRDLGASFLGVETKCYAGNYFDASYKCQIHSIALLTLWKKLQDKANAKTKTRTVKMKKSREAAAGNNPSELEIPPIPSIVVIGHQWALHWTYWEGPGKAVFLGPYDMGNTASMSGTLKLLAVMRKLKHWAEHGMSEGDIGIWPQLRQWVMRGSGAKKITLED